MKKKRLNLLILLKQYLSAKIDFDLSTDLGVLTNFTDNIYYVKKVELFKIILKSKDYLTFKMKKNIYCFDEFDNLDEFDGIGDLEGDYSDYEDDFDEDDLEFSGEEEDSEEEDDEETI